MPTLSCSYPWEQAGPGGDILRLLPTLHRGVPAALSGPFPSLWTDSQEPCAQRAKSTNPPAVTGCSQAPPPPSPPRKPAVTLPGQFCQGGQAGLARALVPSSTCTFLLLFLQLRVACMLHRAHIWLLLSTVRCTLLGLGWIRDVMRSGCPLMPLVCSAELQTVGQGYEIQQGHHPQLSVPAV